MKSISVVYLFYENERCDKMNLIPCPKNAEIKEEKVSVKPVYRCVCSDFLTSVHVCSELSDRLFGLTLNPGDEGLVVERKEDLSEGE